MTQFEHDKSQYLLWKQAFNDKKWTSAGDRLREQYYLTKQKIHLAEMERNLSENKIQLDKELARLETLCQTETAKEKIAFLAASLLFKNSKIAQEYKSAKKLVCDLSQKLQEAEKRFKAFEEGYRSLKPNRMYRVIPFQNHSTKTSTLKKNELAAYAVQLVARFTGNNLEMEKDWEMMSESDKDEIIRKKIIREL